MTPTVSNTEPTPGAANGARSRLLRAAAELIHAQSYHSVGVKAICDRAGVQRGSFYHFFESKEALVLEALDVRWKSYGAQILARCEDQSTPPRRRIENVVGDMHEHHRLQKRRTGRVLGCVFGNLAAESSSVDEGVLLRVDSIFLEWTDALRIPIADAQARGEIDAGISADALADQILADLQGLTLLAKVRNDPDALLSGGLGIADRLWASTPVGVASPATVTTGATPTEGD